MTAASRLLAIVSGLAMLGIGGILVTRRDSYLAIGGTLLVALGSTVLAFGVSARKV